MKKVILILSLAGVLMMVNSGMAISQEKPKPKKDTVNMDTDAKPKFYYPVEDEKANKPAKKGGSGATIAIIAGAVVLVGAAGFFILKKKK